MFISKPTVNEFGSVALRSREGFEGTLLWDAYKFKDIWDLTQNLSP